MANGQQKGAGTPAVLKDRYNIYPGQALPEFATGTAQAFGAEDLRAAGKPMVALLVKPGIPYRAEQLAIIRGMETPGLMTLIDYGVIEWPPIRRKVMAILYERPLGGRVMPDMDGEFRRVEDNELIRKAVKPIAAALHELAGRNIAHRAVRPTNMYWTTTDKESIVLGDCVTSPPGFDQPVVMETIESSLCHPAGRGSGYSGDDLYSFGASLLMLLIGRNPLSGMPPQEIIRQKIVEGSYQTVAGNERIAIQLIEMIKGLLSDDPKTRWTQDSLDQWLSGKRLSTVQTKIEKRATRGFTFMDRDYFSVRELAIAFCANWDQAVSYVSDGRLELWLRRSVDAKETANSIAMAVNTAGFASADKRIAGDMMLCKVCLILDRLAPIRYKSVSTMPDAVGALLAVTMAEGGEVRPIADMILREVQKTWMDTREYTPDNAVMDTSFRTARGFLERGLTLGNGIERVLYEMNDSIACQSPFTADDFVLEIRDLLPALNATAKKAEGKAWPVDRHVAAFIGARTTFDVDRNMSEIAESSSEKSMLGMLNLLAILQWRQGQSQLFGLTSWIGGLVQPIINTYHNRQKRRDLEREVPRLVRQGNLIDLARLLDSVEERVKDQNGFDEACAEYRETQREIKEIEGTIHNRDETVAQTAQQVAALVSVSLALVTVLVLLVSRI
ncbi:MAG TPA: hypothetical protein VGG27_05500 [Magnetospirillaceae bacterium]|jgi:hypothetical protein